MTARIAVFALAAWLGLAGAVCAAPLTVRVLVVSAGDAPVAGAQIVIVNGAREEVVALSARDGSAAFALEPAAGTLVFARLGAIVSERAGLAATLRLALRPAPIGSVVARSAGAAGPTVSAQGAAALATGDVLGALAFVPNYRSADEGGSGQLQLDGTPLSLPPSSAGGGRFGVPASLLTGFSPTAAEDGTITPNLHILAPTAKREFGGYAGTGSQARSLWRTTSSGRSGVLGYAFVLAGGGSGGVLGDQTVQDESGVRYSHGTSAHQLDASLNLTYDRGTLHAALVGIGTRAEQNDISRFRPGALLAGLGPGNVASSGFGDAYAIVSARHGRDYLQLLDVRIAGDSTDDDRAALSDGVPIPSYSGYRFSGHYDEALLTRTFSPRESLTFRLGGTGNLSTGFSGPGESTATTSTSTFAASYARRRGPSRTLTVGLTGSERHGSLGGGSLDVSLGGSLPLGKTQARWSLYSAQTQTIESYYAPAVRLSAPTAATFDCAAGTAFATGTSAVSGSSPHAFTATAALQRSFGRVSASLGGFVSLTHDALVLSLDDARAVGVDPGYLAALSARYGRLCGTAAPLRPGDLFLTRYHTVGTRVGREWYASASAPVGPLTATFSYETYALSAFGVPAVAGSTTLIAGSQLPGIPLHRASGLLSGHSGALQYAFGAQAVSGNNAAGLPGYVSFSAGLREQLHGGQLTLAAQNLGGTRAGRYATSALAAGVATTGGSVFAPAVPLVPVWSLKYEFGAVAH